MMKEVVRTIESGMLAEVGLVAFFVAFLLIVAWAFLMKQEDRDAAKNMPLQDPLDFS